MVKKIKAVLFDFDGVLANTMEDNYAAWKKAFSEHGAAIKRADFFPLEGAQLNEVAKTLADKYAIKDLDCNALLRRKEQYFAKISVFRLYDGVNSLIDSLKISSIKIAIVSAGHRKRLLACAPIDFLNKFDAIVTGEDVAAGKPAPDPYLKALAMLGIGPGESIVIENSPLGIRSAKNAGVAHCIAICSTLNKSFLLEADDIIDKFEDLIKLDVINEIVNATPLHD